MKISNALALVALSLAALSCSGKNEDSDPASQQIADSAPAAEITSLSAVSGTSGPYVAVMSMHNSLPGHTVYRPESLDDIGGQLPIVSFGNGACINVGNLNEPLLGELASHGYLVIATGPIGEVPDFAGDRESLPEQARTEAMLDAVDWAVAENARAGSAFNGKIAAQRVAVSGHSCGGLQAIASGADPRVNTVAVLNSGIIRGGIPNPDGTTRQPAGIIPADENDLKNLHTPVIYLMGGDADQAQPSSEQDFQQLTGVPVFHATLPVGHGGTWREPAGGKMAEVMIAWFDWQLKDEESAAEMFIGEPCGLCEDSNWTVKRKNWPAAE